MSPLSPVATYDLVAELARRFATTHSALLLLASSEEETGVVETVLISTKSDAHYARLRGFDLTRLDALPLPQDDVMGVTVHFEEARATPGQ